MRLILFLGGAAALGWQILWSHHLGLALGASARGVALTVATAMAGMTLGAIAGARILARRDASRPILLYGWIELAIGLGAILPTLAGPGIMRLDTIVHEHWPGSATVFTLLALAASIGPACIAMGATVPVMGLVARSTGRPLSRLYAFNTAGAAAGSLGTAFLLIPVLGLGGSALALATIHLLLALVCAVISRRQKTPGTPSPVDSPASVPDNTAPPQGMKSLSRACLLVFLSGSATFLLEVSWFRLIRSAWFSTSDSVAVMLFCFLVALAAGAALAPGWKRRGWPLPAAFLASALLVVLATQVLARFDLVDAFQAKGAWRQLTRVLAGITVIVPPVALLGLVLPGLLDEWRRPREWSALYAVNTAGSVIGANAAAWLLMEWAGPAPTAWTAGALLTAAAWIATNSPTWRTVSVAGFALVLAPVMRFDRGETVRVRGASRSFAGPIEPVEQRHGPDVSIAVVGFDGGRGLLIDGFATTAESSRTSDTRFRYMDSIGRIPMLLHPDPRDALVICFGTGQTAHAVRDEGPRHLDLVDLNAAVFDLGHHFRSNHGVLEDPRVHPIVMDGRAWLRRGARDYDVVTLEPMPPFFSGTNALYSTGFYRLVDSRLRPGGLVAQWFPIHLMTTEQAASIAAAFIEVFPDSLLWLDPGSLHPSGFLDQGILVGRKSDPGANPPAPLGESWPGFARQPGQGPRGFSAATARAQIALDPDSLRRFAAEAVPVTDDNLLLEYGTSPFRGGEGSVADSIRRIHGRIRSAREEARP
jgi:spermidine synthase